MITLTTREKTKRNATVEALKAIPHATDYTAYKPLVLAAVRKCGPVVWQWLDEGPGYGALGGNAFAKLRTVRNTDTAELFQAVNARR